MRKIVYYIAISLDGFISGPDEDESGFVGEGNGVSEFGRVSNEQQGGTFMV